jgi:hypothetical protein
MIVTAGQYGYWLRTLSEETQLPISNYRLPQGCHSCRQLLFVTICTK